MKAEKSIYFENLDGLRAMAFTMVFLFHFFAYIPFVAHTAFGETLKTFILEGHLGVNLFFVLSGFLITYLLIAEKEQSGRINVRYFYIRRILRIWPLYFLVVLSGFFIYPLLTHQFAWSGIREHLPYYVFFTGNFDRVFTGFAGVGNDALGVLWSVAVEEQFYIFWPLVMMLVDKKYYVPICLAVIATSLVYRYANAGSYGKFYFHTFSVMSDLAVGALLAFQAFYKTKVFRYLQNSPRVFIGSVYVLLFIAIIYLQDWWHLNTFILVFERLILSVFFAFIIFEQCFARFSLFKIGKWHWLGKTGIISYSLYCLHMYTIVLLQKFNILMGYDGLSHSLFFLEMIVLYALNLAVAYLSYRYFEKLFLNLKQKFVIAHA